VGKQVQSVQHSSRPITRFKGAASSQGREKEGTKGRGQKRSGREGRVKKEQEKEWKGWETKWEVAPVFVEFLWIRPWHHNAAIISMGSISASVSCQRDRLETYGVCLTTVDCVLTGHQAMMVTVTQYQVPNWPSRFQPDGLTPCSSVFDRSLFVVRYRVIQSRWDESACAAQSDLTCYFDLITVVVVVSRMTPNRCPVALHRETSRLYSSPPTTHCSAKIAEITYLNFSQTLFVSLLFITQS